MENRDLDGFKRTFDPEHLVGNPNAQYGSEFRPGARKFIITAAQNATPVDGGWWSVLLNMAESQNAELVVIPFRYKNPTSQWAGSQENEEHWFDEVKPYLFNQRVALNDNIMILGDIKIQPTAVRPLIGNDAISSASSAVIGHSKLQLRAIPTPSNRMAKIQTTTGACTVENYSDTRAGKVGEFHHSLSAIIIEIIDQKHFRLRQLHYDRKTQSCSDLDTRWFATHYERAPRPLALAMGDTHVDFIDPKVEAATFNKGGMIDVLRPQHLIFHDVTDSYSCSPHHKDNPFIAQAKRRSGMNNVKQEVVRATDFVVEKTAHACDLVGEPVKSIIIPSNHNDMLARWMIRADWKEDPTNAEFYLETALRMIRGTKMAPGGAEYPDPFTLYMRDAIERAAVGDLIRVLDIDESFVLGKVELGMHGDRGPNGARGSIMNLRRIGIRSIIGHSHTPGIEEGCYQTGTSTLLRLEYNHGASSWLNAHVLLHADGKRQLIIIVDGDWHEQ